MNKRPKNISCLTIFLFPLLAGLLTSFPLKKVESAQLYQKISNQFNLDTSPGTNYEDEVNIFRNFSFLTSQVKRNNYQNNRVTSIKEIKDITQKDDSYLALKELISKYQFVRLYSDGSFRGKQAITGYETIDLMGALLKSMSDELQKACGFKKPPEVQIPRDIDQNSFYHDSYKELAKFSLNKRKRFYGNEDTLTRGGFVVMLSRYLLEPIVIFISKSSELIKTKESTSQTQSIPKIAQSSSLSQVTSVSQFSDVQPTDFFFKDLQSLVSRYGCVAGYSNGTFRPNQEISRGDSVVIFNYCVRRVEELILIVLADEPCAKNLQKKYREQ